MSDMKITAVAPWFGSNRMLASRVGELMGRQKWIGVPFAGGMSELLHLQARTIVVNDLHRHVINLARVMADRRLGPQLYRRLRRQILHPDTLASAQTRCETVHPHSTMPDLQWAEDYFISAWFGRSHSAGTRDELSAGTSLRWNASGGDSAVRAANAVSGIPAWRKALRGCSFTTIDAITFLGNCKDDDGHGIYCDPPFPGPGDKYKFQINQERLAERMASFQRCRVVMRFYRSPLIERLYPAGQWIWNEFKGRTQANRDAPEVLLTRGDRAPPKGAPATGCGRRASDANGLFKEREAL